MRTWRVAGSFSRNAFALIHKGSYMKTIESHPCCGGPNPHFVTKPGEPNSARLLRLPPTGEGGACHEKAALRDGSLRLGGPFPAPGWLKGHF